MKVVIDKKALKYVNGLKESDRRLVKEHIVALVNPRTARDVEVLEGDIAGFMLPAGILFFLISCQMIPSVSLK